MPGRPIAILPIYVSLEKIDRSLLEAATDLGDGPLRRFLRITLPLSLPGAISADLAGLHPDGRRLPDAVAGRRHLRHHDRQQHRRRSTARRNNGPLGAALSIAMMLAITLVACAFLAADPRRKRLRREGAEMRSQTHLPDCSTVFALGYLAFLYMPVLLLPLLLLQRQHLRHLPAEGLHLEMVRGDGGRTSR